MHFGRQVRKARRERGWSVHELARRTGLNAGTVSRIENGILPPTERTAAIFDKVFTDRHGWFSEFYRDSQDWTPPGFRHWHEHEDPALRLAAWSPGIIHGLLQTEAYARALLEIEPAVRAEMIEKRLNARMTRQRRVLFRDDPPECRFVVDHAALHREVASPDAMIAQMDHLLSVAELPHVTLQILPARAHCANASELIIADDSAYVEHLASGYVYTETDMVTSLERIMTTIQADSRGLRESLALIREARDRWIGERAHIQGRTEDRA